LNATVKKRLTRKATNKLYFTNTPFLPKPEFMHYKLSIVFILLAQFSFSQSSLNKDQINRLADAGKVWGYIKYYHPYLQYKDISWDSAFAATVPDILGAKNKEDYEKCFVNLFSVINDPVTAVIHRIPLTTEIKYTDLVITDSVMVISLDDYRAIINGDTLDKIFAKAISQLGKVKAVIFDLRPDKETCLLNDEVPLQDIFDETEILSNLFQGIVTLPAIRTVATQTVTQKPFITELPENNSNYQSDFFIERQKSLSGKGKRNIPIIFIVNKYSELPKEALALQSAGKATIIQEENGGEIGIVPVAKFYIADDVAIRSRLGEIIHSDNGLGFHPNLIIPESENRNIAIEKAKDILKAVIQPYQSPERKFSGFTRNYNNKSLTKNSYPSVGERVLAAAKIYSVLKYFYPNKHLWTHNWDSVYLNFLPRFVLASDSIEYVKTVMEMYAYVQDGHGFMQHPLASKIKGIPLIPPPIRMRVIENQLVITNIIDDSLTNVLGIKKGDIIMEKDGINAIKEIDEKRKYSAASNYDAQSGYIANIFLGTPPGNSVQLKLKDASGKIRIIQLPLLKPSDKVIKKTREFVTKGNDKPIMYFITKDIGYANLGALVPEQVDSMFNLFKDTKAIIFDVRTYPQGGPIYSISPRLRIRNIPQNRPMRVLPGWDMEDDWVRNRKKGVYEGKVVALIHENTQSHGEVTAETLAMSGTLIGNHTAGANGNVVSFFVPGGIRLTFSGGAARMQGKGIQPDILVTPTIKGIQQGKDEILERAVKFIQSGN
jgi:C-terminal processing protease CtpA/Prc